MPANKKSLPSRTLQSLILDLSAYWAERGCILQQPYDLEVGAGTSSPETFLRALGPAPYRVAYVQPSRRPDDGRYGENPNRLYKHMQMQVILKPPPPDIQDLYLQSLETLGIRLRDHDLKFEEDNWENPTLGAWGLGWQVMLDGLEITQFTYFQQCGGIDLNPISVELTYGIERIAAFLQDVDSVYSLRWNETTSYGQVRWQEEQQFSVYQFEMADVEMLWAQFNLYEKEARRMLDKFAEVKPGGEKEDEYAMGRFPVLPTYELVLKCSHLFNLLDTRGALSVTERAGVIGRVRQLACGVAAAYMQQPKPEIPQPRG